MRKVFRSLADLEEVRKLLAGYDPPDRVEEVPLEEALGRVLAEDVVSPVDVPGFDRATKDGYAVRAEDVAWADEDNPVKLRLIGVSAAGHPFVGAVSRGEAVEIATGAPIPKGANAVVPEEYTSRENGEVVIFRAVAPGDNVQGAGSDIRRGETVAYSGTVLSAREIGSLAAAGIARVKVRGRPRVAVYSTGDELEKPGSDLPFGKIYDVNSYTIHASLRRDGAEAEILGILPDDYDGIKESLSRALSEFDMVIMSGSTSVGSGDVIYRVLEELGPPGVLVHGVAIHPGKPTVIAEAKGKLLIGLPGYPTSALTVYNAIVSPLIRRWTGRSVGADERVTARVAERIYGEKGRRDLLPVHVVRRGGRFLVFPVPTGSEAITTLSRADGYVELEKRREIVEEGEIVEVKLFEGVRIADVAVIGSHCLGLEAILSRLRRKYAVKFVIVGSTGGFRAVSKGEADIAGVHALDPKTREYNLPFMESFGLRGKAVLVRGYTREQGLIVARGNPKGIRSLRDLIERKDLVFINRNRGSGTRMLLDAMLEDLASEVGIDANSLRMRINGYWNEAKSHSAVAAAVYHGMADVGIGIKAAADLYGLKFIKLAEEKYDFVIRSESLDGRAIRDFLSLLRDDETREVLNSLPGIVAKDDMGEVIWT